MYSLELGKVWAVFSDMYPSIKIFHKVIAEKKKKV